MTSHACRIICISFINARQRAASSPRGSRSLTVAPATLESVQVVPDYREGAEFKKFFDADYKRMAAAVKSIGKL